MRRTDLVRRIFEKQTFLCIGLDPDVKKLPKHLLSEPDPVLAFNRAIIDATRDLCVAYKPNLAFYEALGAQGWITFQRTVEYIGDEHLIIADAKRGDIGNTSRMYAQAFFEQMGCHAVTVAPYMGEDSVRPFLGFEGRWAIVLALTSNVGSQDFQQSAQPDGDLLYEKVLRKCSTWGGPDELMFVVGATHPEAFEQVRAVVPDHFLLVPGVGAQGGDLAAIAQYGMTAECGLLVNASRSILYASDGADFAGAARYEAQALQTDMARLLSTLAH
jgi:orotidine-5'-phosphate decarboxylase